MVFCKCFNLYSIGGASNADDSERIRILPSAAAGSGKTNTFSDADCQSEQCSSFTNVSSSSVVERRLDRSASNGDINDHPREDSTFYSGSFSLSPSDLHPNYKRKRSSLNGKISVNDLYQTQSECKISIHRNPVDNSYIKEKYGIMPSESTSQKVLIKNSYLGIKINKSSETQLRFFVIVNVLHLNYNFGIC